MESLARSRDLTRDRTNGSPQENKPSKSSPSTATSFEINITIHVINYEKEQKVSSIRRWVKFMVLEVALQFFDSPDFTLDQPEADSLVLDVSNIPDDLSFEVFCDEFVDLLRQSTRGMVDDQSVLNFLSVAFIPKWLE